MWSLFGNQSDSPYDLYVRQYRFRWFMGGLALACVLLAVEMMGPSETAFLSPRWVTVLLLLCLVLLLYTTSVYIKDGLKVKLTPQDDLDYLEREKELYYGKWELRKAYLKSLLWWWLGQRTEKRRAFPGSLEAERGGWRGEVREKVRDVRRVSQRPRVVLKNHPNDLIAAEFLKEMKLDGKMTIWVQRIKRWLFHDLIPLILDNHYQNLNLLNDLLEEFTSSRGQIWVYGRSQMETRASGMSSLRSAVNVSLQEVQKLALEVGRTYGQTSSEQSLADPWRQPSDRPSSYHRDRKLLLIDAVRQRSILEKYFHLPSFPATRDYVLSRFQSFRFNNDLSLRPENHLFRSDLNRVPTDVHILAHMFFTMLNVGNNKTADPNFDITREFLYVYPTLPKAVSRDQVFFYQVINDWHDGPQYDIISGMEHWVAWSGDDNLYYAIALFLLHVRERSAGKFMNFDCAEMMQLIE